MMFYTYSMPDNLNEKLSIGLADDDEIIAILSGCFPCGSGNTQSVEYQNDEQECAVKLAYKDGVITEAVRGPALTEEKLSEIVGKIESAILTEGAQKISRSFLFSYEKVDGFWKYRDLFQIMPAPAEAPDPTESYAQHPFVLEISYKGSSDWRVGQVRTFRKQYEIRLLLHLFLNGNVVWEDWQTKKKWVFVGQDADLHSEWSQLGYTVPNFQAATEEFSDTGTSQPLTGVEANDYFSRHGITTNPLEIPASLTALFDAFYNLSREDREQFLRACFWYYTAGSAWEVTPSLHYNCLITAIETLMGRAEAQPCEHCGKDTSPGPTGKFKTFLQTYAPESHNARDRDRFYALRSTLSHGGRLFRQDLPRTFGALHPTEIEEWSSGGDVSKLTRVGLINWLSSRETE